MKEFNLSDKINDGANTSGWHKVIYLEDVKEFIRLLKENGIIHLTPDKQFEVLEIPLYKFNKLVGDKLIDSPQTKPNIAKQSDVVVMTGNKTGDIDSKVIDYLDKQFPKGDKRRGEAMCLLAIALSSPLSKKDGTSESEHPPEDINTNEVSNTIYNNSSNVDSIKSISKLIKETINQIKKHEKYYNIVDEPVYVQNFRLKLNTLKQCQEIERNKVNKLKERIDNPLHEVKCSSYHIHRIIDDIFGGQE